MAFVSLQAVKAGFGGPLLLEGVDLSIDRGERVCLVGRNGAGKSTVLRMIMGEIKPDGGAIVYQQGVRITLLTQEVPHDIKGKSFDIVAGGLGEQGRLIAEYHLVSGRLGRDQSGKLMDELEKVQQKLEATGGWEIQQRIRTIMSRLKLAEDVEFSELSGGLKRRVLLARALAGDPDLLLLDEPTNHLDIDSIAWLEQFLLEFKGTLLFVTHDRMLLERVATRIVELDRGRLTSWPGNYQTYLERKQAALDAEAVENAKFDKKLAEEEAWIRQGIKARRTRNEGRVRALKELRRIRAQRREVTGTVRMQLQEAERSGKLVIEGQEVAFSYPAPWHSPAAPGVESAYSRATPRAAQARVRSSGRSRYLREPPAPAGGGATDDRLIMKAFSTMVVRGDKVGIIGPNGSGKTTLLKLLLGELKPEKGTIKHGTNLEIAYLDQHRAQLNDEKTVQDNVANDGDYVTINGNRRHVIGYLQDFLFTPERARSPVKVLSGGERNRLLLARLFARPSNLLVLDEPTNDLDIETLDLLEELLMDYPGTLLLVSHDRAFLNNVVTSCLVFEGEGRVNEYVGGYDDWLRQRKADAAPAKAEEKKERPRPPRERPRKLTFKEQKELDALPQRIEALEAEQQQIHASMADPNFYRESGKKVSEYKARLEELEKELADAYKRWEELEAMRG